ncbi:MAG: TolB family protein [Gemmatimonadaceae bacterium]
MRAIDGKVIEFGGSQFIGEWQHKITPSQAKQKAVEYGMTSIGLKDVHVSRWRVDGGGGKRNYAIGLRAVNPRTAQTLATSVSVDAEDGTIRGSMEGWRVVPDLTKNTAEPPKDRLPIWTKQGLVFSSQRLLNGIPTWAPSAEQLFVRDAQGQLASITSDLLGGEFSFANASSSGDWMAFNWHGWSYALNLNQGSYRVLADPTRFLVTPAMRPDGKWMVAAGKAATGNAGLDLMPDALERTPEMALRGRLLIPKSDEFLPTFSPDGKWLYFLKSTPSKDGATLSLQRIAAALVETTERLPIAPEEQQTVIEKLPFLIERLSISPDGGRLIAQAPNKYVQEKNQDKPPQKLSQIFIIGTGSKEVRELKLPPLKDVEVGATIQDIEDAWAGPGNDEVTFSGKTVDAAKKERRRIYSCRFDGSGLQALTPAENKPVPAYQFPQGPKTAYELAKEMALGEIAWDDKHRDKLERPYACGASEIPLAREDVGRASGQIYLAVGRAPLDL